jgi:hypothetical protein
MIQRSTTSHKPKDYIFLALGNMFLYLFPLYFLLGLFSVKEKIGKAKDWLGKNNLIPQPKIKPNLGIKHRFY